MRGAKIEDLYSTTMHNNKFNNVINELKNNWDNMMKVSS